MHNSMYLCRSKVLHATGSLGELRYTSEWFCRILQTRDCTRIVRAAKKSRSVIAIGIDLSAAERVWKKKSFARDGAARVHSSGAMMRVGLKFIGGATAAAFAFVLVLSTTVQGQSEENPEDEPDLPSMPTSEPATGPMGTGPRWEANTPYASGPGAIDYDHLPAADRAIADKVNAEAEERGAVLSIYAASAQQDFAKGMTKFAQLRLGIEQLDQIGVVGGAQDGADGTPGHGASGLDNVDDVGGEP